MNDNFIVELKKQRTDDVQEGTVCSMARFQGQDSGFIISVVFFIFVLCMLGGLFVICNLFNILIRIKCLIEALGTIAFIATMVMYARTNLQFQALYSTLSFYTDSEWDASICLHGETCAGHCAVGAVTQHNWFLQHQWSRRHGSMLRRDGFVGGKQGCHR